MVLVADFCHKSLNKILIIRLKTGGILSQEFATVTADMTEVIGK